MKRLFRALPSQSVSAACLLAATLAFGHTGTALAADQADQATGSSAPAPLSLITANADEGFALAVKLSQKAVGAVQPDVEVRKKLRPDYANDPNSLIAVSQVVAIHFQTIAEANDYWED